MAEDTPITLYVSDDEKRTLRREAEAEDLSLSAYCKRLIRQQRSDEAAADVAEQLDPEQRILDLTAEAEQRIQDSVSDVEAVAADLRDMQARSGAYAIATFELVKTDYADPTRRDALATAQERLRMPFEEHDAADTDHAAEGDGDADSDTDDRDLDLG